MSNKNKIKELIWFTISCSDGGGVYMSKLWKLLFYAESNFYQSYEKVITGVKYKKNQHGPTPDYKIANYALRELIVEGYINEIEDSRNNSHSYSILGEFEIKYLSNQQKESIINTCNKFSKLSAKEIGILSHSDPVYLMAEKIQDELDFSLVKYRSLDEDLQEDEKELGEIKFSKKTLEGLKKVCISSC